MARPRRWLAVVQASRAEACLAVRMFNDPLEPRSFEAFVVHMHLAWLYLLHAQLGRDGLDFRYWDEGPPRRLQRVDGEPKRWELAKCVKHRWPVADAVRSNIEFFIALRNRIEHRYARQQESLTLALAGHSQAILINYEEELTSAFGIKMSLGTLLRFPVFIGTFTEDGKKALLDIRARLPKHLQTFITGYHAGLDPAIESDHRFEFRARMTLELARRDPLATAIQFTSLDEMTEDEIKALETLGSGGITKVITKERQRYISNLGWLKPSEAMSLVAAAIPLVFNMNLFVDCYRTEKVRPRGGSAHPEKTMEQYCRYDTAHRDYLYSVAYVQHLIKHLSDPSSFKRLTGRTARPKQSAVDGAPGADPAAEHGPQP